VVRLSTGPTGCEENGKRDCMNTPTSAAWQLYVILLEAGRRLSAKAWWVCLSGRHSRLAGRACGAVGGTADGVPASQRRASAPGRHSDHPLRARHRRRRRRAALGAHLGPLPYTRTWLLRLCAGAAETKWPSVPSMPADIPIAVSPCTPAQPDNVTTNHEITAS
jgi:hypothetical protein